MRLFVKYIILLIIFQGVLHTEENLYDFGIWKIKNINGAIALEGNYREQESTLRNNYHDLQQSTIFNGMFKINTSTYFWHPNFLTFDANFDYSPNLANENYIVIPNRSESTNAENIGLTALFFNNRPMTVSLAYNKGISYTLRDFGTSTKRDQYYMSASSSYFNEILPFSVYINHNEADENEINSDRKFNMIRTNFGASASKSLFGRLDNKFFYNNDNYENTVNNFKPNKVNLSEFRMNNQLIIDRTKDDQLNSDFTYYNQTGAYNQEKLYENISFRYTLPEDFKLNTNYLYDQVHQDSLFSSSNQFNTRLEHQLYLSLHTYTYYQIYNAQQFTSNEQRSLFGLGFDYSKLIPTGQLQINYEIRYDRNNRDNAKSQTIITNEPILIDDIKVILLKYPFIIESSIVVKDITSAIIYQNNLDYIILRRGDYIEIQKLPGSRIDKNQRVFIDYIAENPINYNYDLLGNNLYAKVSLLKRAVEIYGRMYRNDIQNASKFNLTVLNKVFDRMVGLQLNYEEISLGYEYDNYKSDLMPYKSEYLYLRLTNNYFKNLLISLYINYMDYIYPDLDEFNNSIDVNFRLLYRLTDNSMLNIESSIINQTTRQVNSNYLNLKAEYSLQFAQIYIILGLDYYNRKIQFEKTDYKGIFLKVERRF